MRDWRKYGKKKEDTLGMAFGTASHRLRTAIMFDLIQTCNRDVCFRCDEKIQTAAEMSIEHKEVWEGVDARLFWDLSNIAFSHKGCNYRAGRSGKTSYNAIRTTETVPDGKAWCSGHKDWLPVGSFHRSKNKAMGLHEYCKECRIPPRLQQYESDKALKDLVD